MASGPKAYVVSDTRIFTSKAIATSPFHMVVSFGTAEGDRASYTGSFTGRQSKWEPIRVIVKNIPKDYKILPRESLVRMENSYLVFDDGDRPLAIHCTSTDVVFLKSAADDTIRLLLPAFQPGYIYGSFVGETVQRYSNVDSLLANGAQPSTPAVGRWLLDIASLDGATKLRATFAMTSSIHDLNQYLTKWRPGVSLLVTGLFRGLTAVSGDKNLIPELAPSEVREIPPGRPVVRIHKGTAASQVPAQADGGSSQADASKKRKVEDGSNVPSAEPATTSKKAKIEEEPKPSITHPDALAKVPVNVVQEGADHGRKGKAKVEDVETPVPFAPTAPYKTPPRGPAPLPN